MVPIPFLYFDRAKTRMKGAKNSRHMQRLIFEKPLNQTTLRGFLIFNVQEQRNFPTVLRSLYARNEFCFHVKCEQDDWQIVAAKLDGRGRLQLKIGALLQGKNLQKGDIILCKQLPPYEHFLSFTFNRSQRAIVDENAEENSEECTEGNAPMVTAVDATDSPILFVQPRSGGPVADAQAITGEGIDITFSVFCDALQGHSELFLEFEHESGILIKLYSKAETHFRKEMYITKVLVRLFPCAYRYVVIERSTMGERILKELDFRVVPQPHQGTCRLVTDDILADTNPVVVEARAPEKRPANLVLDLEAGCNKDFANMLRGCSLSLVFPLQLSGGLLPHSVRMMFECFAPFYMDNCQMTMRYQVRMRCNSTKSGLCKMFATTMQTVRPGTVRPGFFQSTVIHIRQWDIANFQYQFSIEDAVGAQVFQELYWTNVNPGEQLQEIEGRTSTHCMCFQRALCYPQERTGFLDFRAIAQQDEVVSSGRTVAVDHAC